MFYYEEQGIMGMSKTDLAVSPRQTVPKKYPGRLWCSPLQAKPAHNDILCTDSKGNQAKQDKPAGRSLAAVLLCVARCAVFGVLHCPNRAQKQSHTHNAKTKPKANTTEKSKQGTSKAGKRHTLKRDHETDKTKRNRQHKQESLQACLLL